MRVRDKEHRLSRGPPAHTACERVGPLQECGSIVARPYGLYQFTFFFVSLYHFYMKNTIPYKISLKNLG